jgi:hypothetical protein
MLTQPARCTPPVNAPAGPTPDRIRAWGLFQPAQRRYRRHAAFRHVVDGNSSGDRLQPRDDRQGRQKGGVGASKRERWGGFRAAPFSFKDRRNNTACAVFRTHGALTFLPPALSAPCLPRLRVPARAGLFCAFRRLAALQAAPGRRRRGVTAGAGNLAEPASCGVIICSSSTRAASVALFLLRARS